MQEGDLEGKLLLADRTAATALGQAYSSMLLTLFYSNTIILSILWEETPMHCFMVCPRSLHK